MIDFSWSNLSSIGKAKIIKLTILTPFIGYIVIFNENIGKLIKIEPKLDIAYGNNISNIDLVYLGLVFVGIASALFHIFCPDEIKKNEDIRSYIAYKQSSATESTQDIIISIVSKKALRLPEGDENLFHYMNSINLILRDTILNTDKNQEADTYLELSILKDSIGKKLKIIANEIANGRFFDVNLKNKFDLSKSSRITDFITINYNLINYSRSIMRVFIAITYFIGFSVLSIPTVRLTSRILEKIFS